MYRLAYRKFADGHESLVVTDSVLVSGNKRSQVDGMRWYELRNPSAGTPTLFQQGTFSPNPAVAGWAASPWIRWRRRVGLQCVQTAASSLLSAILAA